MKHKKNTDNETRCMPIGMCLGISIGTAIGVAVDNLSVCMPVGLAIGLCIGAHMDAQKNKTDRSITKSEQDETDHSET